MALSPFSPIALLDQMRMDAEAEGVYASTHILPDARAGAYGIVAGMTSPAKNIAAPHHGRHPGTPVIGGRFSHIGTSR